MLAYPTEESSSKLIISDMYSAASNLG